jgi:hypothetical protein
MPDSMEGGCQCGAIRYRVNGTPKATIACHCAECQKQSGSAFGMSMIVLRESFELLSGELQRFSRPADSGSVVECAFCPGCGTRIYHQPSKLTETLNVKPGTLDDTAWLKPALQVWVKRKQPWVALPEGARCFDGNPG